MLKFLFIMMFVLTVLGYSNFAASQYVGNIPSIPDNSLPRMCVGGIGPEAECPMEIINKTNWAVGSITWDRPLYHEKKLFQISAKVIVQDFDMNTHPTIKDWIAIQLWSKSSPDKITISPLFELSENSGIFEGSITLLNETSNPFQNKLKVNKTDVIFASYYDWTLPENQNSTKIEIIAESLVDSNLIDKQFCGNSNSQVPLYGCLTTVTIKLDSPLKQFKSGIPINEITCKEHLQLIIKNNGNPACVKSESFEKLYLRGWGDCAWNCSHPIPENIIEHGRELAYLDKTMDVQGTDHSVKYRIDGNATVTDSIYSEDSASVIITLDTITSGSLTIELPRTLIDSGHTNCDPSYEREDSFAVLIDNVEVRFEEIATTSEKRTLSISFQENTKKIEIVSFCLI